MRQRIGLFIVIVFIIIIIIIIIIMYSITYVVKSCWP